MSRRAVGIVAGVAAVAAAGAASTWLLQHREPSAEQQWALVDRYCVTCHNEIELAGDLGLDRMKLEDLHGDAKVWENVIRKVRGHLMPPPGEPRPEDERLESFARWLETSLDDAALDEPNPGAPSLHRLNRAEYANAIRDLIDLPISVTSMLPGDDSSGGFDNIANALSVSPALMQSYVSAAAKVSRLAIGDPTVTSEIAQYRAPRGLQQADHLEGQPLGTRGGLAIEHVFPLDAKYEIRVGRAGSGFGLAAVGADEDVEISIDGERKHLLPRNERSAVIDVPAGAHTLSVAIVKTRDSQGVDDLFAVHAASAGIANVSVVGPIDPNGPGDTPSRRKIFVCTPASEADETACATTILKTLARRAYRRPIADDDPALAILLDFYSRGRESGTFDTGIQHALARALVDPEFIFRFEHEPDDLAPGAIYELGGFELASRLSFFLWSSIPDDELLAAAESGELATAAGRERQVRRMLADSKANALVQNFASQWLLLRQLDTVVPSGTEFDGNLRKSFRQETEELFRHVLREDLSIVELLDASYTFVDERLARHYRIPNIRGSRFRRVDLPENGPRRGLLGHGSVLTVTSAPNRTSPVKRGQWVLENILGSPVPPPPAGVETNLDQTAPQNEAKTMRERLVRHQEDPGCAGCHKLMDPIGFAMENFDFIGKWRDADGAAPVDPHGEFVDGSALDGPVGLRRVLLERKELFAGTFTEKLMTYALGRTVEYYDMPAVRKVVAGAASREYAFSSLVLGVVESVPFRMKLKAPPEDQMQANASPGAN